MRDGPLAVERIALAITLLSAVALSFTRVDVTDTPWHLATARQAIETGRWPTRNTFSYTHPDHPLYQQYPVYQSLLYGVHRVAGWEGLSVLHGVLWFVVFLLWIRWGGTWGEACAAQLAWTVCLWGLKERMILRPDLVTILWFVSLLHLVDQYRKGRWWTSGLFVLVQWLMANSHQLYPIGLATQLAFIAHLVVVRGLGGRWGIAQEDRDVPIWPAVLAGLASAVACLGTPLGWEIVHSLHHTTGSLRHHRDHVLEFLPFYHYGSVLCLVIIATVLTAWGFWRTRRSWQPFEAALWLLGGLMVGMAVRGVVFYVPLSIALFARCVARAGRTESSPDHEAAPSPGWPFVRIVMVGVALGAALLVFQNRWIRPIRGLGGVQPGLGRTLGNWPDATIDFLRRRPPPGRMLNLGWYSGNALLWGLYPGHEVFVDPRFEAYPRSFLLEAIAAESDDVVLARLIESWSPSWMVAEMRLPRVRQRVRRLLDEGQWALVHADTQMLVLVRDSPATGEYLRRHRLHPQSIDPPDWLEDQPDLLGLQLIRVAECFRDLGVPDRAEPLLSRARELAPRHPAVAETLGRLDQ